MLLLEIDPGLPESDLGFEGEFDLGLQDLDIGLDLDLPEIDLGLPVINRGPDSVFELELPSLDLS